jgi:hypothetical protein
MQRQVDSPHARDRIERCVGARWLYTKRSVEMKQPRGRPLHAAGGGGHEDFVVSVAPRGKFYVASAAVLLLVVLVGFAPTFYLRPAFGAPEFSWRGGAPQLSWRVVVHGLILTSWFLMFALQAALVVGRRTAVHRALGWAGAAIGLAVVISGGLATPYRMAELAAQGRTATRPGAAIIAWSNTTSIVAFAILLAAAIVLRRRADSHKRLMLLASISLVQPAFGRIFRWPVFAAPGLEGVMLSVVAPFALVGALIVYDFLSQKSLHRATVMGTGVFGCLKLGGVFLLAPSWLGPWLVRAMVAVAS